MEMKLKKQTIKFWAESSNVSNLCPVPVPSKEVVPKWYKDLSRYSEGNKLNIDKSGGANMSVKACMPFLDSLTSGYMIKLHCDILVEWQDEDTFTMKWTSEMPPLTPRGKSIAESVPTANGYTPFLQAWEIKYCFKAPKGYSLFVTHPLNRLDLPFISTSGVVDADKGIGSGGVPFALKKGFSGIIEAGTPILQLVPFKREDWKKELIDSSETQGWSARPRNKITGWYKNELWQRKSYE
jgi:hypothetical protein